MDCGIITSKSVLLLISLIFWAAGGALVYVGSYVIQSYSSFTAFLDDKNTLIPAAIIIVAGVVMFLIGLVGCCATFRESKVGLSFFLLFILVIFAAEVAALVFGVIYQNRIGEDLERSMGDVFRQYDGENAASTSVDFLQRELKCCGLKNYSSWAATPWFTSHNTVPPSCCRNASETVCTGSLDQPQLLYAQGCESMLEQLLQGVLSYALLVILGFAIIKFFGMLSVCVITCKSSSRRIGYQQIYA